MVYFLPFLPSSLPLSPFLSPFWNSLPPSADSLKRQRDHSIPSLAPFSEQHGFREKSFKPSSVTPHPERSWAGCFSFCSLTYGRRELMSMLQDFFFFFVCPASSLLCGLSLVAVRYSSPQCSAFSLRWFPLFRSTSSRAQAQEF